MNTIPLQLHMSIARKTSPALRWDGLTPIDQHREACTQKLRELLGMDKFTPCDPQLDIIKDDIIDGSEGLSCLLNGCRHIHFTLQTEEGYHTHCHLILPSVQMHGHLILPSVQMHGQKLPLCVCLQGHTTGAHISLGMTKYPGDEQFNSADDQGFCIKAVAEGFAALTIEQRGFGLCGGTPQGPACERHAMTSLLLGRTLLGARVWDVMRVLDGVEAYFADFVTMEGSVLVGHSGGGTATYYTACLEHRFDGYISSCAVCTYGDSIIDIHHCTCNYVPRIAEYFDMGDLAVMIAPKKLVVVCGERDDIFPLFGVEASYRVIETLYAVAGVPRHCALVVGDGGHRFYADQAWSVMKELLLER